MIFLPKTYIKREKVGGDGAGSGRRVRNESCDDEFSFLFFFDFLLGGMGNVGGGG